MPLMKLTDHYLTVAAHFIHKFRADRRGNIHRVICCTATQRAFALLIADEHPGPGTVTKQGRHSVKQHKR